MSFRSPDESRRDEKSAVQRISGAGSRLGAFRSEQRADWSISEIPVIVIPGADSHRFNGLDAVAAFEKPVKMSGGG